MRDTLYRVRESMRAAVVATRRLAWQIYKYGVLPPKVFFADCPSGNTSPVILISIPKAGTNLVERALCLNPEVYRVARRTLTTSKVVSPESLANLCHRTRGYGVITTHLRYRKKLAKALTQSSAKIVLAVREPRDIIISNAFYIPKQPDHYLYGELKHVGRAQDRINMLLRGQGNVPSIREILEGFVGWIERADCVVRFEDLIGPAGGGTNEKQRAAIQDLTGAVGVTDKEARLNDIAEKIYFEGSRTFRKGTTDQWRQWFTPEMNRFYRSQAGDVARRFGY